MADGSVRANQAEKSASVFFSIRGNYVVAPGSTADQLLSDVGCLAECADAGLQAVIDGISDQGSQMAANPKDAARLLYGVMYQVQMMANLANAALRVMPREQEVRHG